jgi:hypothetical protein
MMLQVVEELQSVRHMRYVWMGLFAFALLLVILSVYDYLDHRRRGEPWPEVSVTMGVLMIGQALSTGSAMLPKGAALKWPLVLASLVPVAYVGVRWIRRRRAGPQA